MVGSLDVFHIFSLLLTRLVAGVIVMKAILVAGTGIAAAAAAFDFVVGSVARVATGREDS